MIQKVKSGLFTNFYKCCLSLCFVTLLLINSAFPSLGFLTNEKSPNEKLINSDSISISNKNSILNKYLDSSGFVIVMNDFSGDGNDRDGGSDIGAPYDDDGDKDDELCQAIKFNLLNSYKASPDLKRARENPYSSILNGLNDFSGKFASLDHSTLNRKLAWSIFGYPTSFGLTYNAAGEIINIASIQDFPLKLVGAPSDGVETDHNLLLGGFFPHVRFNHFSDEYFTIGQDPRSLSNRKAYVYAFDATSNDGKITRAQDTFDKHYFGFADGFDVTPNDWLILGIEKGNLSASWKQENRVPVIIKNNIKETSFTKNYTNTFELDEGQISLTQNVFGFASYVLPDDYKYSEILPLLNKKDPTGFEHGITLFVVNQNPEQSENIKVLTKVDFWGNDFEKLLGAGDIKLGGIKLKDEFLYVSYFVNKGIDFKNFYTSYVQQNQSWIDPVSGLPPSPFSYKDNKFDSRIAVFKLSYVNNSININKVSDLSTVFDYPSCNNKSYPISGPIAVSKDIVLVADKIYSNSIRAFKRNEKGELFPYSKPYILNLKLNDSNLESNYKPLGGDIRVSSIISDIAVDPVTSILFVSLPYLEVNSLNPKDTFINGYLSTTYLNLGTEKCKEIISSESCEDEDKDKNKDDGDDKNGDDVNNVFSKTNLQGTGSITYGPMVKTAQISVPTDGVNIETPFSHLDVFNKGTGARVVVSQEGSNEIYTYDIDPSTNIYFPIVTEGIKTIPTAIQEDRKSVAVTSANFYYAITNDKNLYLGRQDENSFRRLDLGVQDFNPVAISSVPGNSQKDIVAVLHRATDGKDSIIYVDNVNSAPLIQEGFNGVKNEINVSTDPNESIYQKYQYNKLKISTSQSTKHKESNIALGFYGHNIKNENDAFKNFITSDSNINPDRVYDSYKGLTLFTALNENSVDGDRLPKNIYSNFYGNSLPQELRDPSNEVMRLISDAEIIVNPKNKDEKYLLVSTFDTNKKSLSPEVLPNLNNSFNLKAYFSPLNSSISSLLSSLSSHLFLDGASFGDFNKTNYCFDKSNIKNVQTGGSGDLCGNEMVDPGEECDDGNTINGDGCSSACMNEGGGQGGGCMSNDDCPQLEVCNNSNGMCEPTMCQVGNQSLSLGQSVCSDSAFNPPPNSETVVACTTQIDGHSPWSYALGYCQHDISSFCIFDSNTTMAYCSICGNSMLEGPEQCDDGNTVNGDGCSDTCMNEGGGQGGGGGVCNPCMGNSECPGGAQQCVMGCCDCGLNTPCNANNPCPQGQFCDQGCCSPNGGGGGNCGLNASCMVNADCPQGQLCDQSSFCCTPGGGGQCGNGMTEQGEECDDGNSENQDACTNMCMNAACGDGVVCLGWLQCTEQCDDGNTVNGDGCSGVCMVECIENAFCTQNIHCNGPNMGNVGEGDCISDSCHCNSTMGGNQCGNGMVDPGEECDFPTIGCQNPQEACMNDCSCSLPGQCGNMVIEGAEECDDGNLVDGDGCDHLCQNENAVCGNGIHEPGEGCEIGFDPCAAIGAVCILSTCTCSYCGNGIVNPGEECDDGNTMSGDGCSATCMSEGGGNQCGNGMVDPGEECDLSDPGSGLPDVECPVGFQCINCDCVPAASECGNGMLDPGEQCDDGNVEPGDGCSATCMNEGGGNQCGNGMIEGNEECEAPSWQCPGAQNGNEILCDEGTCMCNGNNNSCTRNSDCSNGQVCCGGSCKEPCPGSGGGGGGGLCASCTSDNDCSNGVACVSNKCYESKFSKAQNNLPSLFISQQPVLVFNNELWTFNGANKHIYKSMDGIAWSDLGFVLPVPIQSEYTAHVFNNRMWIIGGLQNGGMEKKCYSSADGINWNVEPSYELAKNYRRHTSVILNGKLILIGGIHSVPNPPQQFDNLNVYIHDGNSWTEHSNAFLHKVVDATSVVFNNKIYVIGNFFPEASSYVYYSSDGINWNKNIVNEFQGLSGATSVVFDNKIWVIGGSDASFGKKVFYSSDGVTWKKLGTDALSDAIGKHVSVVYNNKILAFGRGVNGSIVQTFPNVCVAGGGQSGGSGDGDLGSGKSCQENNDCDSGEACIYRNFCRKTCAANSGCGAGFCTNQGICGPQMGNGNGVIASDCMSDNDCASGVCHDVGGILGFKCVECESNSDCLSGQTCNGNICRGNNSGGGNGGGGNQNQCSCYGPEVASGDIPPGIELLYSNKDIFKKNILVANVVDEGKDINGSNPISSIKEISCTVDGKNATIKTLFDGYVYQGLTFGSVSKSTEALNQRIALPDITPKGKSEKSQLNWGFETTLQLTQSISDETPILDTKNFIVFIKNNRVGIRDKNTSATQCSHSNNQKSYTSLFLSDERILLAQNNDDGIGPFPRKCNEGKNQCGDNCCDSCCISNPNVCADSEQCTGDGNGGGTGSGGDGGTSGDAGSGGDGGTGRDTGTGGGNGSSGNNSDFDDSSDKTDKGEKNSLCLISDQALDKNIWYHIAVTSNGKNSRVFVNGKLVAINNAFKADYSGASLFGDLKGKNFVGKVGQVRFYNRALTVYDVKRNNEYRPRPFNPESLTYWLEFKDVAGLYPKALRWVNGKLIEPLDIAKLIGFKHTYEGRGKEYSTNIGAVGIEVPDGINAGNNHTIICTREDYAGTKTTDTLKSDNNLNNSDKFSNLSIQDGKSECGCNEGSIVCQDGYDVKCAGVVVCSGSNLACKRKEKIIVNDSTVNIFKIKDIENGKGISGVPRGGNPGNSGNRGNRGNGNSESDSGSEGDNEGASPATPRFRSSQEGGGSKDTRNDASALSIASYEICRNYNGHFVITGYDYGSGLVKNYIYSDSKLVLYKIVENNDGFDLKLVDQISTSSIRTNTCKSIVRSALSGEINFDYRTNELLLTDKFGAGNFKVYKIDFGKAAITTASNFSERKIFMFRSPNNSNGVITEYADGNVVGANKIVSSVKIGNALPNGVHYIFYGITGYNSPGQNSFGIQAVPDVLRGLGNFGMGSSGGGGGYPGYEESPELLIPKKDDLVPSEDIKYGFYVFEEEKDKDQDSKKKSNSLNDEDFKQVYTGDLSKGKLNLFEDKINLFGKGIDEDQCLKTSDCKIGEFCADVSGKGVCVKIIEISQEGSIQSSCPDDKVPVKGRDGTEFLCVPTIESNKYGR